jgi:hypothetical protein
MNADHKSIRIIPSNQTGSGGTNCTHPDSGVCQAAGTQQDPSRSSFGIGKV